MSKETHPILVIDDDYDLRQVLTYALEDLGYRVAVCGNGQEALNWLVTNAPPIVIILDLMMPTMTGREFLKIKNEIPKLAAIPIIIMSASVNLDIEFTNYKVLRKPFQFEDINKLVSEVG